MKFYLTISVIKYFMTAEHMPLATPLFQVITLRPSSLLAGVGSLFERMRLCSDGCLLSPLFVLAASLMGDVVVVLNEVHGRR